MATNNIVECGVGVNRAPHNETSKLVDFDDSLSQFVCKKADFSSEDKKWRR